MNEGKQFDPIVTSKKIESRYRSYIESVMRFDDGDLRDQLSNILEQPASFRKDPSRSDAALYEGQKPQRARRRRPALRGRSETRRASS